MKAYLNLLVILLLSSITFMSCNSDSSEDQAPDEGTEIEIEVEDFSNFAEDPKLREYIEPIVASLNRIKDSEIALNLFDQTELTNNQKEKLANALGFDTHEQKESHYNNSVENWEQLSLRFDLKNQDTEEVNKIINDIYLELLYDSIESNKLASGKPPGPLSACNECIEPYEFQTGIRRKLLAEREIICLEAYEITDDIEEFRRCFSEAMQEYDVQLFKDWDELVCCLWFECFINITGSETELFARCDEIGH